MKDVTSARWYPHMPGSQLGDDCFLGIRVGPPESSRLPGQGSSRPNSPGVSVGTQGSCSVGGSAAFELRDPGQVPYLCAPASSPAKRS